MNQLNIKFKLREYKFEFSRPKRHFLVQNCIVWRIKRENRSKWCVCSCSEELRKNKGKIWRFCLYISHTWGAAKNPGRIDP